MNGPSYPPARAVAQRIRERLDDSPAIDKPVLRIIEDVISTAFWASLRREEGKSPRISMVLIPPEQVERPLRFESPLSLSAETLARLGPAVERPGIHLGVWWDAGRLYIWGTTRIVPVWCFVLEVVAPGLLVVKYRQAEPSTKFVNIAVLEGAQAKFIAQRDVFLPHPVAAPSNPLLAFYASSGHDESDNPLVRIALSMREHGRGGSLLIVPQGTGQWRDSIVQPITYSVVAEFSFHEISATGMRLSVESLAGATAVDGATVISDALQLLAFGVKIIPRDGRPRVEKVLLREPIEGAIASIVEPSLLGGTRHLSAAQFAQDQPESFVLVASQDGRFTVFTWSERVQMVEAHRLEALLL